MTGFHEATPKALLVSASGHAQGRRYYQENLRDLLISRITAQAIKRAE